MKKVKLFIVAIVFLFISLTSPSPTNSLTGRITMYVGNANSIKIELSNGSVQTNNGVYPLLNFSSGWINR